MSELICLRFGALPWQPAGDVELVQVYDRQYRPTCGLIEQQGRMFLFDCIEGQTWDIDVWAYAQVDEGQVFQLGAAQGEEFAHLVDHVLKKASITVALAVGDRLEMVEVIERGIDAGEQHGSGYLVVAAGGGECCCGGEQSVLVAG